MYTFKLSKAIKPMQPVTPLYRRLLTWAAWVMANVSMTASIYESNGRKLTHLVLVNACNTLMCLVTMAVIWYYRH